jgi:acetolactate synthase I/II/III large subunit
MNRAGSARSGGQILADQLRVHGAELVFGVPGESYLAVLDGLYDHRNAIRYIVCRQEGGAAMMAEAYGKLTGRPGICMVTRGPGATNASSGVHVAFQDSTPLILLIGQVPRRQIEREAFQEIDYRRMYGQMAKWVAQIDDASRIPEFIARAFQTATSGRPGPVVLALPEDMLTDTADVDDAWPYQPVTSYTSPMQMQAVRALLAEAERPLLVLGGSLWDDETHEAVQRFAEANDLPAAAVFRRQDRFDNGHPSYVGDIGIGINPKLQQKVKEADLLLVLGARLDEMTTGGYTLIGIPTPKQTLIHVHPGAEELGRVYQARLAINASPRGFAALLDTIGRIEKPRWSAWRAEARKEYEAWQQAPKIPGELQMGEIVRWLDERLPPDTIWCNGAGNFATWAHRFHRYRKLGTQLAPTSGSMGYGFPAAVAAKIKYPERHVICLAGDGDFQMTGQELATAVQYRANVIVLLVNNNMLGTIRMHQEREYPERVIATELRNPDFAALAKAYGAHGETVKRTEEFAPAFERALQARKPAVIDMHIDPEAITPTRSLTQIREAAKAKT